jgi:hypothetical protein
VIVAEDDEPEAIPKEKSEEPVPVPVTAIDCGPPGASSLRVISPERVPDSLETKLTVIVHLPPALI